VLLKLIGRERRARDVADEAFEARPIATIEGDLSVYIDAVDVCVCAFCGRVRHQAHGADELGGALASARAE
jgi:hypothetical protein